MSFVGDFLRLLGTSSSFFHVGGPKAPAFKRNGAVFETRTFDDAAFAIHRAAMPVGDNDLATKQYVDLLNKPVTVTAQFDGNNALPANTGVEHLSVVTTTGPNAAIGQLIWDDGSGAGTAAVVPALDGRSIFTSAEFTGGTITLAARSYYVWSVALALWQLESSPEIGGAIREVRFAIGTGATQDSASKIPANARITDCQVAITTAYSGGTTITVGRAGSLALLQAATDNSPTLAVVAPANTFAVPQDTDWGASALAARVTIAGGPGVGAGFVIVRFTEPNL